MPARSLEIAVGGGTVSALLLAPPAKARACYVLAHGAGAGMTHPFMVAVAEGLAQRGIATLRYQFPYMELGSRRPDAPGIAQAAVRAAVAEAARAAPGVPLIAGGKSFGGRMTSQAQAVAPLPGVLGLAFLGFPLHAAGRPSDERAKHLFEIAVPMLFLQGAADKLADPALLAPLVEKLRGSRPALDLFRPGGRADPAGGSSAQAHASLKLFRDADHSFHVPARSGRKDAEVMMEALDALATWTFSVTGA